MEPVTRLYIKRYTMAEWSRFGWGKQEILCNKYHVIITNYIPKKRRLAAKINKAIDMVQKGIDKMDRGFKKFDGMKDFKIFPNSAEYNELVRMPKNDYSGLMGKSRNYSFLTGKGD